MNKHKRHGRRKPYMVDRVFDVHTTNLLFRRIASASENSGCGAAREEGRGG